EQAGTILLAYRGAADRMHATEIANLATLLGGARLHSDGNRIVAIESGNPARAFEVNLTTGATSTLAHGLVHPITLVFDTSGTQALILEEHATGTRLLAVDLATGVLTPLLSTPNAIALVVAPPSAGSAVIIAAGATGQINLVSLSGQPSVAGPMVGT